MCSYFIVFEQFNWLFLLENPAAWTDWSWWKVCSKSCDGGVRSRERRCTNPPPLPGGSNCTGNSSEIELCNVHPCPGKMNNTNISFHR